MFKTHHIAKMTEKQKVLNKIDNLLAKRTAELLKELPDVHEVDDGIIIRFFTEWDNCADDDKIKYKKIENEEFPDESVVFWYLPKGSGFELKQRFYIGCVTCLNGKIDIEFDGKIKHLRGYQKICVNSEDVVGRVHENTYLMTTSDRSKWSKTTYEHMEELETN